mmetsp:Transcript_7715/g.11040  ORF Transcript_7715/g.11040 Transcript_7715/m.11040 type:complete len:224 (+) Transcript_7715:256-927(+)
MNLKADLTKGFTIQNIPSIKDEGRLGHTLVDTFVVESLELIPLSQDTKSVCTVTCLVGAITSRDRFFESGGVIFVDSTSVVHLCPHIFSADLGIINMNICLFIQQIANDKHGWSFPNITCILLECISKNSDLLSSDGVEHLCDNLSGKTILLVVVHGNNLVPVGSAFIQAVGFAQVDKVKNILLEAGSSKANRGLKESLSDTVIHTYSTANFRNISTSGLAQS